MSGAQHGRWCYEVRAVTSAPPAAVWPLISESARWQDWSFLTRSFLLREGSPVPDGAGALRRFAVGPFGSCEEVVEFEPPAHLGYVARKGVPVRSYRADIVLHPPGEGTALIWTASLEPLLPGTGRAVLALLRWSVQLFARQLVRYADQMPA